MKKTLLFLLIAGILLSLISMTACSYGSSIITYTLRIFNRTDLLPSGGITVYVFKSVNGENTLLGQISFTTSSNPNFSDFHSLKTGDTIKVSSTDNTDLSGEIASKIVTMNEDWFIGY